LEPLSPVQLRERAVLPDVTFSDSATFTLGIEDPVRVDIANAGGYIPGSSIVTIRDTGVVFVGWLVASHEPPMLRNANLDPWSAALGNLRRNRKIKVVVPASGPPGDLTTVAQTQEYLKAAQSGVKKLVRTHKPREAVSSLVADLLKMYMTGNALDHPFIAQRVQGNLERIYDELAAQAVTEPVIEP
jgi:glyoxylase-like metal-dependent hydrolase (beta-lactamase superfamily II)